MADEVSEEVDSRGKVMHSEKNDWYFLRRSQERVGGRARVTTDSALFLYKRSAKTNPTASSEEKLTNKQTDDKACKTDRKTDWKPLSDRSASS